MLQAHTRLLILEFDVLGIVNPVFGQHYLKTFRLSMTFYGDIWKILFDEDLVARISEAPARVREIPGIFKRVHQSLRRHYQTCIATGRRYFEQFL